MSPAIKQVKRSCQARWNKAVALSSTISDTMQSRDPLTVEGTTIHDLRDEINDLVQAFHEFNAYRNSYESIRGKKFP